MKRFLVASGADAAAGGGLHRIDLEAGTVEFLAVGSGLMSILVAGTGPAVRILGVSARAGAAVLSAWAPSGAGLASTGSCDYPGVLPCHLAVDATGSTVAVADYGSNDVALFALHPDGAPTPLATIPFTGAGPDPDRQDGFHPHWVEFDADGGLVVVGLGADRVDRIVPPASARSRPEPLIDLHPGMGPRHLARVDGLVAISGELDETVTVSGGGAPSSTLRTTRVSTPARTRSARNFPGDVVGLMTERGPVFYVANRGHDTIAVIRRADGVTELVQEVPTSAWPLKLCLDDGQLLSACTDADCVEVFGVDPVDGTIDRTAWTRFPVPMPVWLCAGPAR